MTINDYLDMEALDNILEQWAAATHMIAVVLDDEGNFLSNKLGFSRNNVEAFGESIEVDDVEVATVVGGPLDEDTEASGWISGTGRTRGDEHRNEYQGE